MPHPDRKISFILCTPFVILVWIDARLWENADTNLSEENYLQLSLPSFLGHFHYNLFSFTERWTKLVFRVQSSDLSERHQLWPSLLRSTVCVCGDIDDFCGKSFLGQEVLFFLRLPVCHCSRACTKTQSTFMSSLALHSIFTNAVSGCDTGPAPADEAVNVTSEVGLELSKEDVSLRNDEILPLNSKLSKQRTKNPSSCSFPAQTFLHLPLLSSQCV